MHDTDLGNLISIYYNVIMYVKPLSIIRVVTYPRQSQKRNVKIKFKFFEGQK